jgi:hypothetical protein
MPGFVDVSNMSALEVKRLGQMDDDVDYQPRQRRARPQPASTQYSVSDVWAAACAAQRINGEYVKETQYRFNEETGQTILVKHRNRDVMQEFLGSPDRLLVEDVEAGERVRNFLQNDLTFRAIKGRLTEFDTAVSRCLAVQNQFDSHANKYELAVVASLPASMARSEQRQNVEQRMKFARGGLIAQPGAKITAQVEVVSCNYSQQYNIFWIRGVTDQDQPVMFSNKEAFDAGTRLTVQGKVKAHRDNLTQLNYVKVL